MIEIIDNVVQMCAAAVALGISTAWFLRRRQTVYFFLACHFCTFAFGTAYWLLYLALMDRTPQVFYVSDLSWMASALFLNVLLIDRASAEERATRHPLLLVLLAAGVGMTVYFCHWGDVLMNILGDGMVMISGFLALRGLIYLKRTGRRRGRGLYVAVLMFFVCEFSLWMCSCFTDQPLFLALYYAFDFAVTGTELAILFAAERAVTA